MIEIVVSVNEVLFIPSHWYHEVINLSSATIAFNLWWDSELSNIKEAIWSSKIPIRGEDLTELRREILYFINIVTDLWCHHVLTLMDQEQIDRSHCSAMNKSTSALKYGYLSAFFGAVYPVLESLFNCQDAMNLYIQFDYLEACFISCGTSMSSVLEDIAYCWIVSDALNWDRAAIEVLKKLKDADDIGVAELYLTEFLESMLRYTVGGQGGESSLIPLVAALSVV